MERIAEVAVETNVSDGGLVDPLGDTLDPLLDGLVLRLIRLLALLLLCRDYPGSETHLELQLNFLGCHHADIDFRGLKLLSVVFRTQLDHVRLIVTEVKFIR